MLVVGAIRKTRIFKRDKETSRGEGPSGAILHVGALITSKWEVAYTLVGRLIRVCAGMG